MIIIFSVLNNFVLYSTSFIIITTYKLTSFKKMRIFKGVQINIKKKPVKKGMVGITVWPLILGLLKLIYRYSNIYATSNTCFTILLKNLT